VLTGLKRLLGHHSIYVGLQRFVGADRLRYRCLDELDLKPGETVLDLGCGPAYYLGRLPRDVRYFGFDTSTRYIEHARKRWGDAPQFRDELFTEAHAEQLPPINAVMLLGLLHHLSDEQCRQLLTLVGRALAPGGRVISVDPCFEPTQGRISHWMSANDRGGYVREPEGFTGLAREFFKDVDGDVLNTTTRIPSSHWMMRMSSPVTTFGARG
jgi:SAM-dependent methyltransferase